MGSSVWKVNDLSGLLNCRCEPLQRKSRVSAAPPSGTQLQPGPLPREGHSRRGRPCIGQLRAPLLVKPLLTRSIKNAGLFYVFFQMGRIVKGEEGLAAFSWAEWAGRQLPGLRGQRRVGASRRHPPPPPARLWEVESGVRIGAAVSQRRRLTGEWAVCPNLPSLTIPTARHF